MTRPFLSLAGARGGQPPEHVAVQDHGVVTRTPRGAAAQGPAGGTDARRSRVRLGHDRAELAGVQLDVGVTFDWLV